MRNTAVLIAAIWCVGCGGAEDAPPADVPPDSLVTRAPTIADTSLPTVVSEASPIAYPRELWVRGVEGETELMVLVSDMGAVDSVYVSNGSGAAQLDSAAVLGARQLRFAPARSGEQRIAKWIRVPIRFSKGAATVVVPSGG